MIRRLSCWLFVLAGLLTHLSCSHNSNGVEPPTSPPSIAPTVDGIAATMITTNSVVLTSKVRPNQLQTVSHFEYGATSSYGLRTKDLNIGSDTGAVDFRDTVRDLIPGTAYHFRVVASNSAGMLAGPDSVFVTLVEFVYPLTVGSSWQYHYYYWTITPEIGAVHEINGSQVWQVASASVGSMPSHISISLVRVDTTHDTVHNLAHNSDTTYVNQSQTSFTISVTIDSITIDWPSLMLPLDSRGIPRSVPLGVDTLTIRVPSISTGSVRYVQGVGLVSWDAFRSAIHATKEQLTLLSYSLR